MSENDDNTSAKPEHMRKAVRLGRTVDETIAKLKRDGFQYATAGDARRLIEEIEQLRLDFAATGWSRKSSQLTPEQQKAALAYRGPENHGDPYYRADVRSYTTETDAMASLAHTLDGIDNEEREE